MPSIVWILLWVVVLGVAAFFLVREICSGRRDPGGTGPGEFDRRDHAAVREPEMNRDGRGPNGGSSLYG
jgi:hypothetical protein